MAAGWCAGTGGWTQEAKRGRLMASILDLYTQNPAVSDRIMVLARLFAFLIDASLDACPLPLPSVRVDHQYSPALAWLRCHHRSRPNSRHLQRDKWLQHFCKFGSTAMNLAELRWEDRIDRRRKARVGVHNWLVKVGGLHEASARALHPLAAKEPI